MRRVWFLSLGVLFLASGCNRAAPVDELVVGEPVRHENLTIFPIMSTVPKLTDRFITLDAGLKAGTVEVREVGSQAAVTTANRQVAVQLQLPAQLDVAAPAAPFGNDPCFVPAAPPATGNQVADQPAAEPAVEDPFGGGADVNHLLVLNRSERPLYLMPGEIIIGGQQDRTVANEYVIAPSDKPTKIEVFCVEHGRWGGRTAQETAVVLGNANLSLVISESVAIAGGDKAKLDQIAKEAETGKFVGSVGNVSKSARLAVQASKEQGQVWDRVAETNAASKVAPQSGTFTDNYADAGTLRGLEPYAAALARPISERSQIVGVLVAVNGHVQTLDLFESTPLFRQLWPKLLKSYALDAANVAENEQAKLACSIDEARQFLAQAREAKVASSENKQGVVTSTLDTTGVICFSAREHTQPVFGAAGMSGGMGGSFGGAVHTSGFSK